MQTTARTQEALETTVAGSTSSELVTAVTAETLATAGVPLDVISSKNNNSSRYTSNRRDHYNSCDQGKPTEAITSATAVSVATAEAAG
jgi:hypothetical protein